MRSRRTRGSGVCSLILRTAYPPRPICCGPLMSRIKISGDSSSSSQDRRSDRPGLSSGSRLSCTVLLLGQMLGTPNDRLQLLAAGTRLEIRRHQLTSQLRMHSHQFLTRQFDHQSIPWTAACGASLIFGRSGPPFPSNIPDFQLAFVSRLQPFYYNWCRRSYPFSLNKHIIINFFFFFFLKCPILEEGLFVQPMRLIAMARC